MLRIIAWLIFYGSAAFGSYSFLTKDGYNGIVSGIILLIIYFALMITKERRIVN